MKNKFKKQRNKHIITFFICVILVLVLLFIPNIESKSVNQARHAVDKAVNDASKNLNNAAQQNNIASNKLG
ncbi:hypothetical protein IB642_01600 [Allofrancisella guangzhouensis]|uniref:Uncharacterized protein n=1 Tax=Allofrancisella guangzhouensis TaxID=594679 RepID=A0A0A8E6H4_9GAMM|nr:hypothetical protein [Allofrancisella guangzhouensis]AJC49192.1 hypothetical protein SD28_05875 [Allofrancisella guangzhouensis]MBK2027331.1 hypothetical protein [Allofrancisella guangzhouensis]MBK2043711.1 hypothetical protein [Allofrancisella guangzhouensis]MBK2045303.1 hypothetical protein [Allofrancisella guangzhouensis]